MLRVGNILCVAVFVGGCAAPSPNSGTTIADAVRQQEPSPHRSASDQPVPDSSPRTVAESPSAKQSGPPIAVVNGRPISREAVNEILMRSHGVGVLEQLIGLEAAASAAAAKGISIDEEDIQAEYEIALKRLVDPLPGLTSNDFDREEAERVLKTVLAERNISKVEFRIVMERGAYLRRLASRELVFSDEQLRAEFDRLYGPRAVVRHIQLGSHGDVVRAEERLAAGEDFASVASRYSANTASAKEGGLLAPFSENDEDVPEVFRRVAFSLEPGEVSKPVRIGHWEHLIKLEKILAAGDARFESVRVDVERRLRERVIEQKMRELQESLFQAADIEIRDVALREAFRERHPELRGHNGR